MDQSSGKIMKNLLQLFFNVCPKTGRITGPKKPKGISRLLFPLFGLAAIVWIAIRVVPKPSRANYPCMQVAVPIASSFVIYLSGLLASVFFFEKAKAYFRESRIVLFALSLMLGIVLGGIAYLHTDQQAKAEYQTTQQDVNQPIGTGVGINPGRVVWVHNPNAVNQNCPNTQSDYWSLDANTNQAVVNEMLSQAIRSLTGKQTDAAAWDALFRNFNQSHGRGNVGYTAGEKFVLKLNLNTGCTGATVTRSDYRTVDTSPQIVQAVLDQLVNVVGAAQADITFGDPGRDVDNIFWNKFHSTFPNVHYLGTGTGRTPIVRSAATVFQSSDGNIHNYLPQCYLDATYIINIPVFKQHHRAGISLSSKNYFGTLLPYSADGSAFPYHYSLPCTQGDRNVDNGGYGKYRIFVDFMGHKDLGGKVILYLFDGLWSSTNYGDPPWKWQIAPFNNTYPGSIFLSQDPVAIESVGYDFLYAEFPVGNASGNDFPQYSGVDDFLHQAASADNWPVGIQYDPEHDGTVLPRSMGVHEHWNNAVDKKYSRNLGTGNGIELVDIEEVTSIGDKTQGNLHPDYFELYSNYPNPFNPSTTIAYSLPFASWVEVAVFDVEGREVTSFGTTVQQPGYHTVVWNGKNEAGTPASSGTYIYKVTTTGLHDGATFEKSGKMSLVK